MSLHTHSHHTHSASCSHQHHKHAKIHHTDPPVNTWAHFIQHIRKDKDAKKLGILLAINIVCTLLELIYGFLSNSIGLISDAAHMLFDSTALAVGVYASYKAILPPNQKFSFGYERFQTLAGFINGIFLIFIAFYIFIESLERIYDPPVIYSEKMIVVAVIGLIVNVIGVTFFHEHAHFHGIDDNHSCSHQHAHHKEHQHKEMTSLPNSHNMLDTPLDSRNFIAGSAVGSRTQIPSSTSTKGVDSLENVDAEEHHHTHHHEHHGCNTHHHDHSHDHKHSDHCDHEHENDHHHHEHHGHHEHEHADNHHTNNENLYGVFLHILADLLGSVGVITSSILIMMFDWYIADAICSAVTSLLILVSIVPLLKSSILIFLQTYPAKHEKVFHQALLEISHHPSIVECKEPHLWAYTHDKLVCSLILILQKNTNVEKVLKFARGKLNTIKGIKHLTIDYQMENAYCH